MCQNQSKIFSIRCQNLIVCNREGSGLLGWKKLHTNKDFQNLWDIPFHKIRLQRTVIWLYRGIISQLILFMILEHVVYSCNILYQYYIFTYLASKWFNDELKTGRFHSFNTFLDNMISILIFNASKHISLELGNDQFLLLQGNTFQCLLNHTAPIHLQGQRLHMGTKLK